MLLGRARRAAVASQCGGLALAAARGVSSRGVAREAWSQREEEEDAWWQRREGQEESARLRWLAARGCAVVAAAGGATAVAWSSETTPGPTRPGEFDPALPTVSLAEVRAHDSEAAGGIWMSYKRGVYDVTGFVSRHPGGTKVLLAAGKSIEPYWRVFAAHHRTDVYELLEAHRIANLDEASAAAAAAAAPKSAGYEDDPERHPALCVNSAEPFNAEPPSELVADAFLTPRELFFVRNHLPVPRVDSARDWTLELDVGGSSHRVSLDELKTRFAKATVAVTLQCAGNRRSEMSSVKEVRGLSWSSAAIGTATWGGARLADVLEAHGVDRAKRHVRFVGRDADVSGEHYGASIPLSTALDPRKDVLLAYEMNGEPLPPDHGFPLRVVVPGHVGARHVKFLERVAVHDDESDSFWQRRDYRGFPPNVDYATPDLWDHAGPAIQELPVQSAIAEPLDGRPLALDDDDDLVRVRGYAWAGGGRNIVRVDLSLDDGQTWLQADLDPDAAAQEYNRAWAWTPWEATLQVPPDLDALRLVCKAVDSSYNTQPEHVAGIWNMRGLLNNAYHRVHVPLIRTRDHDADLPAPLPSLEGPTATLPSPASAVEVAAHPNTSRTSSSSGLCES